MLKKMVSYILSACGYVDRTQYNAAIYDNDKLTREIANLRVEYRDVSILNKAITEEISRLDDENRSLWDMLDEVQKSETFGVEQARSMIEDLNEALTDEMLKDFKPFGEA